MVVYDLYIYIDLWVYHTGNYGAWFLVSNHLLISEVDFMIAEARQLEHTVVSMIHGCRLSDREGDCLLVSTSGTNRLTLRYMEFEMIRDGTVVQL